MDETTDLLFFTLRVLEVLDNLVEVVLALADLHAHVQTLALLLLMQDALGDLIGLGAQELLAVGDVAQQLLPHLGVVALLRPLPQLPHLLHALVLEKSPQL